MEIGWSVAALAVLALITPMKPTVRIGASILLSLVALAVFQTTGGRGSIGLTATYVVISAVGLVGVLSFRRVVFPWLFVPVLLYLPLGLWAAWESGSAIRGGLANLIFIVLAWTAGALLGYGYRRYPGLERLVTVALVIIVLLELIVCVLQFAGIAVFATEGRTSDLEGGRANGTFDHPSTVGKVLTLTLVPLLAASRSSNVVTRRWASLGVVLSLLPVVISMSRANLIAIGAMILVWSIIQPREKFIARRFMLPAAAGVVGLVFVDSILERFEQNTGERDHFMAVAVRQFERTPIFGVGPGQYIETVGRFDAITAQGWPVHNIFMLQIVELGVIGSILFYLPFVVVFWRAVRRFRAQGAPGDYARGVIAYLPAFIAIGWTGWGLLAPGTLALACFVLAFAHAQFRELQLVGERRVAAVSTLGEAAK